MTSPITLHPATRTARPVTVNSPTGGAQATPLNVPLSQPHNGVTGSENRDIPKGASEPLLVRVDPDTRAHLKQVADSSDRRMSQLVRYATVWWTTDPNRARVIAAVKAPRAHNDAAQDPIALPVTRPGQSAGEGSENLTKFVNVRFSSSEMALICEVSAQMGLDRGAVVRSAIRAWLAAGDFTALGDPRTKQAVDRIAG